MIRQIQIGSDILVYNKNFKITRIELNENYELSIFACEEKYFEYETEKGKKLLKQKSYDEDHLILNYHKANKHF